MNGSWRRVEHTRRTIRFEVESPVEVKTVGVVVRWVEQEFERLNGRVPDCDNDWWLEPMDEHVAFVFTVEERNEGEITDG